MIKLKWAFAGSLLVRLAALMTIALLPLGLIALYQTNAVVEEATRLSQSAVLSRTESAAAGERELLQRAGGAAEGLAAAVQPLIAASGACSAVMRAFTAGQKTFTFAAFIRTDGTLACTSDGSSGNVSNRWPFLKALGEQRLSFAVERNPDGKTQLLATSPVWRSGGLAGYVSIAVPHSLSDSPAGLAWAAEGIEFATVDAMGEILSASLPLDDAEAILPAGVPRREYLGRIGETFFQSAQSGDERFYAVSEIIPGQVAVIGSWPSEHALASAGGTASAMTLAFPVLMWLAGIAVAIFGLQRMVVRHLSALRKAMRRYALGERDDPALKLESPPREFEEAKQSFNRMVAILSQAERRREQDLTEKTILLREVHHRVKNNLQLIASIMNMLGRGANTPEARRMLAQLQRRVRGLAIIHRTLNTNPDITTIDSRDLIGELINEIGSMNTTNGQSVTITKDLAHAQLNQDQAVTLSMLVSEAMTNAVKYVGVPDGGRPEISVNLREAEGNLLELEIANTKGDPVREHEENAAGAKLGERLMRAFAMQLEGEAGVEETEDTYIYRLAFPAHEAQPPAPAAGLAVSQGQHGSTAAS